MCGQTKCRRNTGNCLANSDSSSDVRYHTGSLNGGPPPTGCECLNNGSNRLASVRFVFVSKVKSTKSQYTPWSCPQKQSSRLMEADPSQFTSRSLLFTIKPKQPIQP